MDNNKAPSVDVESSLGDQVIKLDGREFRAADQSLSAAQDDYILGHLRRAGALEALSNSELSDRERAEAMLTAVMLAGETHFVLAGCLTENSKRWTRAEAQRNAAAFAEISDHEEKLAMRGALIGFVLGFFEFGAKSSATSPKSSSPLEKDRSTESADPGISETSPRSSEKSQTAPSGSTR